MRVDADEIVVSIAISNDFTEKSLRTVRRVVH